MKSLILTVAAITALAAMPSDAAEIITSPNVNADRSITFRYRNAEAREVVLRCEALPEPVPLQKDGDGVWTYKTPPVAPDIYVYSLVVNGQRVLDPLNPFIKYNLFSTENQVEVPGPKETPWQINATPHGVLHRHHYRSDIIGAERDVWIYTPPGYDPSAKTPYPVLYLLHGYSDAEDAWVTVGRANIILDNLIARGLAKPMLIVMPRGYGNEAVTAGGWGVIRSPEGRGAWEESNAKYGDSMRREIIPLVEANYRVDARPQARAIAGLSMGGTQSLLFGLAEPGPFAWIASFSAGGTPMEFAERYPRADEKLNDQLRLLWIGCGTEDGLITPNRQFSEWLKSRGVKHTFIETPGRHSFMVWRRYLARVLPLLFQQP